MLSVFLSRSFRNKRLALFYFPKNLQGVREVIFTKNRYDRSMEQMMKGIPDFYPRGSGIVVTGRFQYTAEMCDCKLCGEYIPKKGCGVPRCVCLEERIAVGIALSKKS